MNPPQPFIMDNRQRHNTWMSSNSPSQSAQKRANPSALELGSHKKPYVFCRCSCLMPQLIWFAFSSTQDPLVHHGRHFGCAICSFCSMHTLLTNGIKSMVEELDLGSLSATYIHDFSGMAINLWHVEIERNLRYSANSWGWFQDWKHVLWPPQRMKLSRLQTWYVTLFLLS